MFKKKAGKKQFIRLLTWIDRYPGFWEMISDPGCGHLSMDKMRKMVYMLAEEGLYDVILFMLEVHKEKNYVRNIYEDVSLKMLAGMIKKGRADKVIGCIMRNLE